MRPGDVDASRSVAESRRRALFTAYRARLAGAALAGAGALVYWMGRAAGFW